MRKFEVGDIVVLDMPNHVRHGVVAVVTRIVPTDRRGNSPKNAKFYEIAYEGMGWPSPGQRAVFKEGDLVGLCDYASERIFQEFFDLLAGQAED